MKLPHPPLAVWRYYNGWVDCENVIKELQAGFALPTLCLEQFWASEAALSLACLILQPDRCCSSVIWAGNKK